MLGLFLLLHVLAASPVLHQDLHHHDCDHPEEQCPVTTLAHGWIDAPAAEMPLPLVSAFAISVVEIDTVFVGFPVSRLLPGRAPPVVHPA